MIDVRLAAVALCRLVAFVALVLAGIVGLAMFHGERVLAWFTLPWSLLVPDLTGRDWATVVLAASAAVVTFTALSVPGLVLFLQEIIK